MGFRFCFILYFSLFGCVDSHEESWDYFENVIIEQKQKEGADFELASNLENLMVGDPGENEYKDVTVADASKLNEEVFKSGDSEKFDIKKSDIPSTTKLTDLEKNGATNNKPNILERGITQDDIPNAGEYLKYSEGMIEALTSKLEKFKSRSEEKVFDAFMENMDMVANEIYTFSKNIQSLRDVIKNLEQSHANIKDEMKSFLKHLNITMCETKIDVRNELKKFHTIIEKEIPEQKESAKLTKIGVLGDENWTHFENDTEFAVEQIREEEPHKNPYKTANEKIETILPNDDCVCGGRTLEDDIRIFLLSSSFLFIVIGVIDAATALFIVASFYFKHCFDPARLVTDMV